MDTARRRNEVRRPSRFWIWLPMVVAWGFVLACVTATALVIGLRIHCEYDNEHMESQIVGVCLRVAHGLPIYTRPSLEYVCDVYAPMYFWICGGLVRIFGPAMLVCRWMSVISTLATAAAIAVMARRSAVSVRLFLGACFLAYFGACSQWFDLARVDMLSVALLAWGCVAAIRPRGLASAIAAGLLLAGAILTKQNFVVVAVAAALVAGRESAIRGWIVGTAAVLTSGAVFLAMHVASDGWSTHYIFFEPLQHGFVSETVFYFLESDLGGHASMLMLILLGTALLRPQRGKGRHTMALLLAGSSLVAMLPGRLKVGGAINHRLVMWVGLLLAVAWSVPPLLAAVERASTVRVKATAFFWLAMMFVGAALAGTYSKLWLDRAIYFDMARRDRDIRMFHDRLRDLATLGPVWAPSHTNCPQIEAQRFEAATVASKFLRDSPSKPAETMFYQNMERTLRSSERPASVVLNFGISEKWDRMLRQAGYRAMGAMLPPDSWCRSLTAFISYPERVYVHDSRVGGARRFGWIAAGGGRG